MTLSEYVKTKKNEGLNVSYSSIAEYIPCSRQLISMIASGKRQPSYPMAKRIVQATNGEVEIENWYRNDE